MLQALLSLFRRPAAPAAVAAGEVPPVLIGATGGSGTRAVHGLLADTGLFMGVRLNGAGDAMDFEPFLDRRINDILRDRHSLDYRPEELAADLRDGAMAELRAAAATYRTEYTGGRWGWKNPRSMYVLPLIHTLYPQLWFIHLIRDGRDMAFSGNQNQPRKHYAALFGRPLAADTDPVAAIELWDTANRGAAAFGERVLGERYIRIRFEDLCAAPLPVVEDLLRRLDLPLEAAAAAAARVATPDSVGRWQREEPELAARVTEAGRAGLEAFGYL